MKEKFYPPSFRKVNFHCPHCHVYANQIWRPALVRLNEGPNGNTEVAGLMISLCVHCNKYSVWQYEKLISPSATGVEPANEDLPEEVKADYNEAARIIQISPRGAAALMRLAIQKLCVTLGEKGKNIDDDIASLVKKGLPVQVQQALDIIRVIGNESVHPGTIDLKDDVATASQLFVLVNIICEIMISQPKHIATMYADLPANKLAGIENRDKNENNK